MNCGLCCTSTTWSGTNATRGIERPMGATSSRLKWMVVVFSQGRGEQQGHCRVATASRTRQTWALLRNPFGILSGAKPHAFLLFTSPVGNPDPQSRRDCVLQPRVACEARYPG